MPTTSPAGLPTYARVLFPGVLACAVVAVAAAFLSEHYGAPVLLFALFLGLAMNFLADVERCTPGIDLAASVGLRVGVALLGLRITLDQIAALGWFPVLLVVASVILTIAVSMAAARLLGFMGIFGLLTGGATAICGVAAALALAAALPPHPLKERATLFTVIGISALSALAMIAYPAIAGALELDPAQAGIFLGGTIHDVATAIGAGYSLSHETGDVATLVKLMRVAMLLPVVVFAAMLARAADGGAGVASGERPPLLPWFVVVFAALVALGATGWIPQPAVSAGSDVSRWCLIAAVAALGMRIRLRELGTVGIRPIVLMAGESVFLTALVLGLLRAGG